MRRDVRKLAILMAVASPLFGACIIPIANGLAGLDEDLSLMTRRLVTWSLYGLLAPIVVAIADRYPPGRRPHVRTALIHIGALTFTYAAHFSSFGVIAYSFGWIRSIPSFLRTRAANLAKYELAMYALTVALVLVLRHRRTARRAELAAARLERRLAVARIERVRAGIDSAAMFEALADIHARLLESPRVAEDRIQKLCRELRARLEEMKPNMWPRHSRLSKTQSPDRSVWATSLAAFLVYPLFGIYLNLTFVADMPRWPLRSMLIALVPYAIAGSISILVIAGARRALSASSKLATAAFIAAMCFAHGLIVEGLMTLVQRALPETPPNSFTVIVLLSITVASIAALDELDRRRRRGRLEALNLARSIADVRLQTLRGHLAPHFLFNTLNSILALVTRDAAAARRMIERLTQLLRVSLAETRQEVPLREELEITNAYLDIERVRFRDALRVRVDVDPDLLDAPVLSFILQPLVENAIRHGLLGTTGIGNIRIGAQRSGASVELTVENDGEAGETREWREGTGLLTTRARLAQLYGIDGRIAVELDDATRVRITLPFRLERAA